MLFRSWPLALNNSAEMGTVFIINLSLGRLTEAELALAAFAVAHGLGGLLMAPVRNLAQTGQTLVGSRADVTVMLRFSTHIVVALAVLGGALFLSPANEWVLAHVMGLSGALLTQTAPAMKFVIGLAIGWGYASLFRGLLAGARTTGALAVTGILRLLTAGLVGLAAVFMVDVNGAIVGVKIGRAHV